MEQDACEFLDERGTTGCCEVSTLLVDMPANFLMSAKSLAVLWMRHFGIEVLSSLQTGTKYGQI